VFGLIYIEANAGALVVAAEVVAIAVGSALLNGPLELPHAVVAWISVVVGAHLFALAAVWREAFFRALGAAITFCGAAGVVVAAGASNAVIRSPTETPLVLSGRSGRVARGFRCGRTRSSGLLGGSRLLLVGAAAAWA